MSLKAYQRAQSMTTTPRQAEYRVFAQVTAALISAEEKGRSELQKLTAAVHDNRKLWSALATDCVDPGNKLPEATRAGIISLSMFVTRYSSEVMQQGASLEPLIDINRSIMSGLSGA